MNLASVFAFLAKSKKAVVTALGVALAFLAYIYKVPFLPAAWHTDVGVVIAVLTPIFTWLVPNKSA